MISDPLRITTIHWNSEQQPFIGAQNNNHSLQLRMTIILWNRGRTGGLPPQVVLGCGRKDTHLGTWSSGCYKIE